MTVYKPETKSGYSSHNVYGYAELSRQYYSHPYVDMVCYVNAYNPGNENNYTRTVYHKFIHQVTRPDNVVRSPDDGSAPTDLPVGGTYSASSPDLSVNIGPGDPGDEIESISYVRLVVTGDIIQTNQNGHKSRKRDVEESWFITETFTFYYNAD